MGLPSRKATFTVEEYLSRERSAIERHEYLDGEIYAMAGESGPHADISVNLVVSLGAQLRGTSCRVRTKDTKVRSGPAPRMAQSTSGLFSYPDVLVVCGEIEYHDEHADVVVNPTVVIEVLSPTTESFDRGEKFNRYDLWNPSLRDYLLVSQDRPQIEHFRRQSDGGWSYHRHAGLDARVALESINAELSLTEVFERIDFDQTDRTDE